MNDQNSGVGLASLRAGVARPETTTTGQPVTKAEGPSQAMRALPTADAVIAELSQDLTVPTQVWWRKMLRMGPSEVERRRASNLALARLRQGPRCLTVMVAQPKGGAGKSTVALGLSGAFGTARGGGVIAWDNNETRGTLADQVRGRSERTVLDIISHTAWFAAPGRTFGDVQQVLARQDAGQFWTLASGRQKGRQISGEDFCRVWNVLRTYVEVLVVDTGNNESASNWIAAALAADVLVVPCKWQLSSVSTAAEMLHTIHGLRPELLARTVIVGSNGPGESDKAVRDTALHHFAQFPLVEIPVDPAIWSGSAMDWDLLQPATQDAFMHLAATVNHLAAPQAH